jgi:hypothetical protein
MEQRTLKLDDGTIVYCYEDGSVEWFVKANYQRMKRSFGFKCRQDYRQVKINGKAYRVHRLIALAFIPKPDGKDEVDHINRIPYDNRAINLRWANDFDQQLNTSITDKCINKYGFRKCDNPKLYTLLYNRDYYKVKNPKPSKYEKD